MKIEVGIPPEAKKGQLVSMDLEMFGQEKHKLHRPYGKFATLSVTLDGKVAYQIFDEHDVKKTLDAVKAGTWVFHNALYDLRQLMRWANIKPRFIWDTMVVEQSMWGGYYQNFGLDDLVRRILGEVIDKGQQTSFESATEMTPSMKKYAATDVIKTWQIAKWQQENYTNDLGFSAYKKIDEPMFFPVLDMQGMRVDVDRWRKMVNSFKEKADIIEADLGFNVKSTQQCQSAMRKIGLNVKDSGAETLNAFKDKPLVARIIEGRLYRDAVSKYGLTWLEKYVEADGKVYPSYHITGAGTGRMSSSNPNGQNIPARKIPEYRTFFVASPGNIMMVSDAHQQEPCVLAYESQDPELLKALKSGEDLHLAVARAIFNEPKMKKDDPRRHIGKTINLGTSYGLSEYGLATRLNISEQEAAEFLKKYFSRFRDVMFWIGNKRQEAYANGFIRTASGRRYYINPYGDQWKNNAINSPIQGGAADHTKRWTRIFWEEGKDLAEYFTLTGIIHDEQTKDVPKGVRPKAKKVNDESFQQAASELFPGVPFSVETAMGKSWACKQMPQEAIVYDEEE